MYLPGTEDPPSSAGSDPMATCVWDICCDEEAYAGLMVIKALWDRPSLSFFLLPNSYHNDRDEWSKQPGFTKVITLGISLHLFIVYVCIYKIYIFWLPEFLQLALSI